MIGLEMGTGDLGDLEGDLSLVDIALSSMVLMVPKVAPVGVKPRWELRRSEPLRVEIAVSRDMSVEPSGRETLYESWETPALGAER